MKRNLSWVMLCVCLLLGACSGGGGDSKPESDISIAGKSLDESMGVYQSQRSDAYKGKTQPAQITKDNLKELSSNLLYQLLIPIFDTQSAGDGSTVSMSSSSDQSTLSFNLIVDRSLKKLKTHHQSGTSIRAQAQTTNSKTIDTIEDCEDGGWVRIRGSKNSIGSWVGGIDVIYKDCKEFGITIDGMAGTYIDYDERERYTFLAGTVIKTPLRNARYTGSIRQHSSGTVSNLLVTRLDTSQTFQLIDWEQPAGYFSYESVNIRGDFYSFEDGFITVTTSPTLVTDQNSTIARGSLRLQGASNSSASVTFIYADQVALEIDLDGDSLPDEMVRTEPLELIADRTAGGTFVTYRAPNYPATFGTLYFASTQVDTTESIEVVLTNVIDPEGDELTYKYVWTVNGEELSTYTEAVLPPLVAMKDQVVRVHAVIDDGHDNQTTTREITLVISDAPPEFFVTDFPETAQVGESFEFDVTFRDPDADDVISPDQSAVRLVYGPEGMSVNDGHVSWTPEKPVFGRAQTFNFGFAVGGTEEVFHRNVRVTDPDEQPIIARSGDFSDGRVIGIGAFDNDDKNEILMTDGGIIQTLEKRGEEYVQDWVYPYALEGASSLKVLAHDINQDGILDILVGSTNSVYLIEDRLSEAPKLFDIDANDSLISMAILEKQNSTELVLVTEYSVRVVDLSGNALFTRGVYNGGSVQVGNVDSDPNPEIILQNGMILDGNSYELEWQTPERFVSVRMIDIDDDGVMELIDLAGGPYRYSAYIRQFDVNAKEIIDLLTIDDSICSMTSGNIDSDLRDELVLGHCGSKISFYDISAEGITKAWEHNAASLTGIKNLEVGDFDSDGNDEILFKVAAWPYDAPFDLFLGEISNNTISDVSNIDLVRFSSYRAAGVANITPAQKRSIFMAFTHINRWGIVYMDEEGRLEVVDVYESEYRNGYSLKAFDYDRDGYAEVFLDRKSGGFDAVQLNGLSTEWSSPYSPYWSYNSMISADVNEDGSEDVVISTSSHLVGLDLNSNTELFDLNMLNHSIDLSRSDFTVANVNGSGWAEILVARNNFLTVWSKDSSDHYGRLFGVGFVDQGCDKVKVIDVDRDNAIDVLCIGHADEFGEGFSRPISKITRLNSNFEFVSSVDVEGTVTDLMQVDGSGVAMSYLVTTNSGSYFSEDRENSRIQSVSAITGDVIWSSPELLGQIDPNNMHYVENEAGQSELTFSTNYAMYRVAF